jgi:hypothetical protein
LATVVIIGSGGGNQQNRAASASIDGQSIVGANGEVIMYCESTEAALRYLQRVCAEEDGPRRHGDGG